MNQILDALRSLDGVLELAPAAGSDFPEIAWGDHFFYYAPDGQVPQREQPFATIVTKNYPDDELSNLGGSDRWRLNIHVGSDAFRALTGEDPRADAGTWDYAVADVITPHPVYRTQGWISIVNPGQDTYLVAARLLHAAHEDAKRRSLTRATVDGERSI